MDSSFRPNLEGLDQRIVPASVSTSHTAFMQAKRQALVDNGFYSVNAYGEMVRCSGPNNQFGFSRPGFDPYSNAHRTDLAFMYYGNNGHGVSLDGWRTSWR